jgi:FtsH-binding integral membrane protein
MNEQFRRSRIPTAGQPTSLLGKAVAVLISSLILIFAFMFSLVALAIVAVGGMLFAGWLWWKTRALRKAMRDAAPAAARRDDQVIEGEFIRDEADRDDRLR